MATMEQLIADIASGAARAVEALGVAGVAASIAEFDIEATTQTIGDDARIAATIAVRIDADVPTRRLRQAS